MAAAPARVNPRSPLQEAQRRRVAIVNTLWAALPLESIARWRAYAEGPSFQPLSPAQERSSRAASGNALFKKLATKYLVVHGGFVAPTEPPAAPFLGDAIVVGVAGSALGAVFSASAPNSPGVLTELLLQRLPARHRLPKARDYRTLAFVEFAGGPVSVPAAPGAYACAVRFVRADTGQESATVPLGTVEVG